ncbi:hypothetical protein MNB_SUP05-7-299 [hydrothermal vent metagenome]|uniref:Uncharacterized protein n=1 Tax=hydrothermal vent metagenome TaxID=652676 RepID=A0A1W1DP54_9ZZZZ
MADQKLLLTAHYQLDEQGKVVIVDDTVFWHCIPTVILGNFRPNVGWRH